MTVATRSAVAMEEDDGGYWRIFSELEGQEALGEPGGSEVSISEAALTELQVLLDDGDRNGGELWDRLAARNLPPSSLVRWIAAGMDSPVSRTSLLASRVYLSALLSASAPIYTLFNPLVFLSLLRSLRRSLKIQPGGSESFSAAGSSRETNNRKNGRKKRGEGGASTSHRFGRGDTVDQETSIEELLLQVLELLELVLDKVRLDTVPDGVKSLAETVAGILKNPSAPHHRLSDSCFRILYGLVSRPQHGDQSQAAIEVMRVLAPMAFLPPKSATRSAVLGFFTHQLAGMARENGEIRKALFYLPRYLAMKAPDKSEPRSSAVDAIVEILRTMESEDQVAFVEYVNKMAQGKAQLRFLAVDLILSLLATLPNPLGVDGPDNFCTDGPCTWWGIRCLQTLFKRCSDVSAVIRARALTNLAYAIGSLSVNIKNHPPLKSFFTSRNEKFNNLLKKRCLDEKAAVRKATLLLITRYTLMTGQPMDEIILKIIGRACSDPLISIRKAAVSALSEVSDPISFFMKVFFR